jgi:hypothetical protein
MFITNALNLFPLNDGIGKQIILADAKHTTVIYSSVTHISEFDAFTGFLQKRKGHTTCFVHFRKIYR